MIIDLVSRTLLGGTIAGLVAGRAFRQGQLTMGGAYTAFAIGTAAFVGGVGWAISLAAFFYSSMILTAWRGAEKRARAERVLPNARARNAWQVVANGGVFAAAAVLWGTQGIWEVGLFGFGALATAAADTWATEIGLALNVAPRSIITWRPVEPGTSGGVSAFGMSAAVAGAFFIALLAVASFATPFDVPRLEAVLVGGLVGCIADSVLGATVQSARRCDGCGAWTERRVHTCGFRTHHARGIRWMTNDTVNLLATVVGGVVAVQTWGP